MYNTGVSVAQLVDRAPIMVGDALVLGSKRSAFSACVCVCVRESE